jgi:tyrosine-protein phosphatase YwqE
MGFFSSLFGKKNQLTERVEGLTVDIHSHLIWGVDDGAKTEEDSIALLQGYVELGYRKAITTPHIMSDFYQNNRQNITEGLQKLNETAAKHNIPITLEAAAEYYLDFDFENKIAQGDLLTFGDNYVLFEISYLNAPDSLNEIVFKLQTTGYKPVLAHPERYPFWYADFEKYESLVDKGVLLQLNLNSLTGHYSAATKKIAERLIDAKMISFAGTDCHHTGHLNLLHRAMREKYFQKLMSSGKLLNETLT